MQAKPRRSNTIRRSFAIPRQLFDDLLQVTDRELRKNVNRLVIVALQEYVAQRKRRGFELALGEMAKDPAIQRENRQISKEFQAAELDGLGS